VLCSPRQEILR